MGIKEVPYYIRRVDGESSIILKDFSEIRGRNDNSYHRGRALMMNKN